MKKLWEFLNSLPAFVFYILILVFIGCFVYGFPRLSYLVGFLFNYGLIIFFIFVAIICVAVAIIDKK